MTELSETADTRATGSTAYRTGIGVAILTCFLTVWTTIVRDDGTGGGFFMIILAVNVGWFAARFQAAGMSRGMLGVAGMQVVMGALVATAPITAAVPDGPSRAMLFSAVFTALWLISAACFRSAARA